MSAPFPALITLWEERTGVAMAPNLTEKNRRSVDAFAAALMQRLGIEGETYDQIEAKIARWEALEAEDKKMQDWLDEQSDAMGPKRAAAQALQPTLNAELANAKIRPTPFNDIIPDPPAPAECGCGGPAGHVPGGVLCRKGWR